MLGLRGGVRAFSSHHVWAWLTCGTWDLLSWPGMEPTSLSLEGGFLTAGPQGKSWGLVILGVFLALLWVLWDLSSLNLGSNPGPCQWKHGVLTTKLSGNSWGSVVLNVAKPVTLLSISQLRQHSPSSTSELFAFGENFLSSVWKCWLCHTSQKVDLIIE